MGEDPDSGITVRQEWFNRLIWAIIFLVGLLDVVWALALGWTFDGKKIATLAIILAPLVLMLLYFKYRYREPRFVLMMHIVLQFMLLVFVSAGFNYVTSTFNLPMVDDQLVAIDRALGFDWKAYVDWVHQYPTLSRLSTFSYNSAWPQLLIAMILLFITGHFVRLQHFCFVVLVGALVSSAIAALLPAVAGYAYYGLDTNLLPEAVKPAAGLIHVADLMALRDGTFNHVDLHFQGIITFPSYHAAFGVFLIYAFWPFVWLRIPVTLLNLMLFASTPVDGGHWLIDVIGGIVMAVLIVMLARKLLPEGKGI